MNQRLHIIVALLIGLSASTVTNAEESWYQVEYILFHHQSPDLSVLDYEDKPDKASSMEAKGQFRYFQETRGTDLSEAEAANPLSDFFVFPSPEQAENTLENAYARLKRDPRTKVYHYRSWQQSFENEVDTLPIKIYERLGNNELLEGQIAIERERFLHAKINVSRQRVFALPKIDWASEVLDAIAPDSFYASEDFQVQGLTHLFFASNKTLPLRYEHSPVWHTINLYDPEYSGDFDELLPFQEHYEWETLESIDFVASRRIKDEEMHYVDHPYFGMIATIKKIDNPNELAFDFEAGAQTN